MTTDPFCAGHNPGETELPAYAVGADGALANVLLRVTEGVTGVLCRAGGGQAARPEGVRLSPRASSR